MAARTSAAPRVSRCAFWFARSACRGRAPLLYAVAGDWREIQLDRQSLIACCPWRWASCSSALSAQCWRRCASASSRCAAWAARSAPSAPARPHAS